MTAQAARFELTPAQWAVYEVLTKDAEMHNAAVAYATGFSQGWTSEILRALERMGLARRRVARSKSEIRVRYTMWRRA